MIHDPVDMVMFILIMDVGAAFSGGGLNSRRLDVALYDYSEREPRLVWGIDANGACARDEACILSGGDTVSMMTCTNIIICHVGLGRTRD